MDKIGGVIMGSAIHVSLEMIKEFFFQESIQRGVIPSEAEAEEFADMCFGFLCEIGAIEEG